MLILRICGSALSTLSAATGYIDVKTGNDAYDGRSPATALASLDKVNSHVFMPGDTILFRADGSWIGQLFPRVSGNEDQPIVIDRYGQGEKPHFNGNGLTGSVVKLDNQSWWEISNLEITNMVF